MFYFMSSKILTFIEQIETNKSDIDKFKLLSNESDMIINLILKHCTRLASIQNRIGLNNINNVSNDMNIQELNQIQRKKEETLYLKQGIDKRALILKDNLKT